MSDSQAQEIYEYLQSELKKSDLEDLHDVAYNYASQEITYTNEIFLDKYITRLIRLFGIYQKENVRKINFRINENVDIQNGKDFQGFEVELTDNERRLNQIQTINFYDIPDFTKLEQGIIELQKVIRRNRDRGMDNGISF
ncbi:hypothetical protein QYS49_32295 [Marivirga salinae]|uniref:Uncharacterized protein n=1 Tax=Marivirga salinarum TaxID=3059078 RepID=A0AA51REA1_9BACT|nr:hypothetical protein [Marivirga sp. BDSF4-3]WMN12074.1 hypothetical protein QYS49_32295 [Marivirga sp. BDSF4-3]